MSSSIKTKQILITGLVGSGKSALCVYLAMQGIFMRTYDISRIYSNLDIFYKNKRINRQLKSSFDAFSIPFNNKKGLLILEEGAVNFNARNSMSKVNKDLTYFLALSRKKNVDIIMVVQDDEMIDINARRLVSSIYNMCSYYSDSKLIFKCSIYKKKEKILEKVIDIISFFKKYNIKYDTLEDSRLEG